MSFNENVQLDTSQVESGGGGGGYGGGRGGGGGGGSFPGGIRVGGGIGGVIILIIVFLFQFLGGGSGAGSSLPIDPGSQGGDTANIQAAGQVSSNFSQCKTGADANRDDVCRVIATVNSVQAFWGAELPKYGVAYRNSKTVIYSGATESACGTASNQVGPFYCPLDKKVYIDASFFAELTSRFGADEGALAKEYVVAHEYGHALQDILGLLGRAQQDPNGPESGAVRTELMADCLAGVWVNHATSTKDAAGTTFMKPITRSDIESALSAASAVGDDRIQKATQGRVNPESWTHGSSAQRQKWFTAGWQTGDINQCNTFAAADLG
jgi:predicted metalloprotease